MGPLIGQGTQRDRLAGVFCFLSSRKSFLDFFENIFFYEYYNYLSEWGFDIHIKIL